MSMLHSYAAAASWVLRDLQTMYSINQFLITLRTWYLGITLYLRRLKEYPPQISKYRSIHHEIHIKIY